MGSDALPHDPSAEASILGGILLRPAILAKLADLEVEDFHSPRHQAVFAAMRNLEAAERPIDEVTVEGELVRQGKLEAIGGVSLIAELMLRVPSAENVLEYAATIVRHRVKLETIQALSGLLEDLRNPDRGDELDGEAAVQHVARRVASLRTREPSSVVTIGAIIDDRLTALERIAGDRERGVQTLTGVPTGVAKLDAHLGGFQHGIVTIVAARPGAGKSSLCIGAADATSEAHQGAHAFSLEDSLARYADRTLARHSGVPPQAMVQSKLTRGQLDGLRAAITRLRLRQHWILSTKSSLTADEIVREVRREGEKNNTKLVVVDYVQIVRPFDRRAPRHEQLDEIATTFATAAKDDDISYLVASQLNRKVEDRPDKRPMLSDLKESGALEERCKCAVMLYRGAMYGPPVEGRDYKKGAQMPSWGSPESDWERTIELLITKNTPGACGDLVAEWNGPLTTIS